MFWPGTAQGPSIYSVHVHSTQKCLDCDNIGYLSKSSSPWALNIKSLDYLWYALTSCLEWVAKGDWTKSIKLTAKPSSGFWELGGLWFNIKAVFRATYLTKSRAPSLKFSLLVAADALGGIGGLEGKYKTVHNAKRAPTPHSARKKHTENEN